MNYKYQGRIVKEAHEPEHRDMTFAAYEKKGEGRSSWVGEPGGS